MSGLLVSVYRSAVNSDYTKHGASYQHGEFILIGPEVEGPIEPYENGPPILHYRKQLVPMPGKKPSIHIAAYPATLEGKKTVFGGNFIYSSDPNFNKLNNGAPIKIFDRLE